jgi:hypothetical protein
MKNKYFKVESNNGNETVYVPDGDINNVEAGIPVLFIAQAPLFIKLLNEEYGTMLLHYQSSEKVDVQRLIIRTVRKYLKEIDHKEN